VYLCTLFSGGDKRGNNALLLELDLVPFNGVFVLLNDCKHR